MKHRPWIYVSIAALVLAAPAFSGDGEEVEPPEDRQKLEVTTGYQGSSQDGEMARVAEYDVVEPTEILGLDWRSSPYSSTRLGLDLFTISSEDIKGGLEVDTGRVFMLDATVDGFLRRAPHDDLSNLPAASDIKTVRATDYEPGADYDYRTRLYRVDALIRPPSTPGVTFRAGYRELGRKGHRQVLTTSHCTSCHVTARGREVDNKTTDLSLGVHGRTAKWDFDYDVNGRRFKEYGDTPNAFYELALRPAPPGWTPSEVNLAGLRDPANVPAATPAVFDDRLWFQGKPISYDNTPENKRIRHQFKAKADFDKGRFLNLNAVYSNTENETTGLEYDYTAYRARYTTRTGEKSRLNAFARYEKLDNDEYLVDNLALNRLDEAYRTSYPPDPPGATYYTYQGWRESQGDDVQFERWLRSSAMDRTDARVGADWVWRGVRRGSLRLGYEYRDIDRDNVVLADGDGRTKINKAKVGWNQRFRNRVRLNAKLTYTDSDNPYVNVDGAMRQFAFNAEGYDGIDPWTAVVGRTTSPLLAASLQYYQLHALRVADVSGVPSSEVAALANASYGPKKGRWSVTGHVRYRGAENDELDYTDWERASQGIGVTAWLAPTPRFMMTLGVDSYSQDTDAEVIIPLMDG
jgi:hypothetical protein